MRVRLSYSVELEDVPNSVAELIEGELYRIEEIKEIINKALEGLDQEEPHLDLVAKSLDKARQTLGAIDVRLNECESILGGYERAINPPEEVQEQMQAPPMARPARPASPQAPAEPRPERSIHPNVDPETREYKYEPQYAVPSAEVEEDEVSVEDEQSHSVSYNTPYEIPRESTK